MNENLQRVMGTANAYIQQPGLLHDAAEHIGRYGRKLFVVTGQKSWESAGPRLSGSLERSGIEYTVHRYRGECSYEEVDRLAELLDPGATDLVVGVGGGKVTDTAKALSHKVGKPFVSIPTLAATCAPVANLSIMYTEDGVYIGFPVYDRNSLLVLVDTDIIAHSPPRFLASGIGDTLAKWYEARVSAMKGPDSLATAAGLNMAKLCLDTLLEHSEEAYRQVRRKESGEALQKVIDAIILISGAVGGFGERFCRSAAAHAIHNGLTALPDSHGVYHGEKVAYGILVQLVMEERPRQEFEQLVELYRKIGLPYRLSDMGIKAPLDEERMRQVTQVSLSPEGTMDMMPFAVTEEHVRQAIALTEKWAASL